MPDTLTSMNNLAVHFFLGFQQIYPAHRKSSQSNVYGGWFTKKAVPGKKRFGNT
jgi:hypothetical protein